MSNLIVLPQKVSLELYSTTAHLREIMNNHPCTKEALTADLTKLSALMSQIKDANEELEKIQKETSSFWSNRNCLHILTGLAATAFLLGIIVSIVDFIGSAKDEADCIKKLTTTECLDTIIDFCSKNQTYEAIKFTGTLASGVFIGVVQWGQEKKDAADERRSEFIRNLHNQEQAELITNFLNSTLLLFSQPNKERFDACINKLRLLKDNDDFFLNLLGSPELITSYLVQELGDKHLNEKIDQAKGLALEKSTRRERRRKKVEGANSLKGSQPFEVLWSEIEATIGISLRFLKVGNQFISSDGRIGTEELKEERTVIDLSQAQRLLDV